MNIGAVLPSITTKCPKCHSTHLRRSHWHRGERGLTALIVSPYRCMECDKRFYKLSHRFEALLGWGLLFLALLIAVAAIIYSMNHDLAASSAKPRPKPVVVAPNVPAGSLESLAPYAKAKEGDTQAQYELGMLLLNGEHGVTKNYGEALKWLEMAAKAGHIEARYNLGIMYKTGSGALQNFEQALQWFEAAAHQNHPDAQYNVALMHKNGMSVPVDFVKSYTWANIAAVQGHLGAINLRDGLLQSMTPAQVVEGQRASRDWKPAAVKAKDTASEPAPAKKG